MKKYWKSLTELHSNGENTKKEPEFSTKGLPDEVVKGTGNTSRRDFLKILGFSVGYAALAASCEAPVHKAVPFLNKPEEITPGIANHYASTFYDGRNYYSLLVKTREGRPIKVEGNELSKITRGGSTAQAQASVLSLYDEGRLQNPLKAGKKTTWAEIDKEIAAALAAASGKIVLLTANIISPSTRSIILDMKVKYPNLQVVSYDAISSSAMLTANKNVFGKQVLPSYYFDKTKLVVSFGADFLGTWLSPVEFSKQFAVARKVAKMQGGMSRLIQLESTLSLTGTNADKRIPLKPSQEAATLLNLYNEIAQATGATTYKSADSAVDVKVIAAELLAAKGKSLVLSASNDTNNQVLVNAINYLLGNYGKTLDLARPVYTKQAIDQDMADLVADMNAGKVGAILMHNVNPAYDYPEAEKFTAGLKKVKLSVSYATYIDETAKLATYICPDHHYLEAWGDAMPRSGSLSLMQPTINPLFDTRQFEQSLLTLLGSQQPYYEYVKQVWKDKIFVLQDKCTSFTKFWSYSLQAGVYEMPLAQSATLEQALFGTTSVTEAAAEETPVAAFNAEAVSAASVINSAASEGFELVLYESIQMGNGKMANNPWLQELPDPVSKVTWENYLAVPVAYASENGLENGDVVKINGTLEMPILIQPGQAVGTFGIALGYGRTDAGKVANGVGGNAYPFAHLANGTVRYNLAGISIETTGNNSQLALTQTHHNMEERAIVRETTLSEYLNDPASGNEMHKKAEENDISLYPEREYPGHHWGMAIDLTACTGCSACVIGCQAENNVAVIGKEEVTNRRIMHWMRIDRYYSDDEENPEVLHQPVMCQHCDHAPCENVCPVAATPHSNEGLNQMAYNRCIGTRYCMNNCPYRVRRFNWYEYSNNEKFPYNFSNDLGKMVLNPDVVVRSRGVVEKCSLCTQRIQEKKLLAKKEGRKLSDGEIKPACLQACSSDAIIFGDLNDKNSEIAKAVKDKRNYHLLEELHTLPTVSYLTKVRNKEA